MPYKNWSIEELRNAYEKLELRVSRFSSIEQKLINTQDLLDQELVAYKRINDYNSLALVSSSIDQLLTYSVEAVVDIFECESSIIRVSRDGTVSYFAEGIDPKMQSSELEELFLNQNSNTKILDSNSKQRRLLEKIDMDSCLVSGKISIGPYDLYIGAFVSIARRNTYNTFNSRSEALFNVFIDQVRVQFVNRFSKDEIEEKIEIIRSSELELMKLSSIAMNTNSGALITDEKGYIQWVNDAFSEITGYQLKEVIGRKPKDFLQVAGINSKEILNELSNKLKAKEPVNVVLRNMRKNGQIYMNELQITPVFDDDNRHINFIAIQRDITKEYLTKKEIETINRRFQLVNREAKIGIWEYDVKTSKVKWNEVLYEMYELDSDSQHDLYSIWENSLISDNKTEVLLSVQELIQQEGGFRESEFQIKVNDKIKFIKSVTFVEQIGDDFKLLGTNIDITSIKESAERIVEQNRELTKKNLELDQFVYSISHDLRAPLLSIKGLISLMDEKSSAEERAIFLEMIKGSVDRLDITIIDILNFARNSRLEPEIEKIDLKAEIDSILTDLQYITDKKIRLSYKSQGDKALMTDYMRISIILKNILSNAVKYTKDSHQEILVKVDFYSTKTNYYIVISDNGIGIDKNELPNIFRMFYRATNKSIGTGLGLYIAKEMAIKLKGDIKVTSKFEQGTAFTIILPLND